MVNVGHLLLFIVIKILFLSCQCLQQTSELRLKNGCYMNKTGLSSQNFNHRSSCPRDSDPIEMNFKRGNVKGSVIAQFLLAHPLCYQSAYKIELLHAEVKNENKTCSGTSSFEFHSERKFSLFECGNCTDACGKYGNVQFFNVVPGCYKANVTQFINSNSYKFRVTNWTYIGDPDSDIWDVKVDIKSIFLPSQGINVSMKFSKPTSDVIIETGTKTMDLSDLLGNEECHFLQTRADTGNITKYDGLSCSFPALSANNIWIEVKVFKDEQCDDEMKFEERSYRYHPACWTKQTHVIAAKRNSFTPSANIFETSIGWTLFGIITSSFFVIFISCCIIFKQLHKRRKLRTLPNIEESAPLAQDTMSDDYEILLLYAKDCKEFMVTMESFRDVLGNLCNVKVYDCFDEPNWEDEQISPLDWIEKIMKFKQSLHIILVLTLSACIQHQGYLSGALNGKASAFKDPSYLDKVFLYGLKIIKEYEISNHHPYGKIFIIQLNGFSDDTNSKELSTLSRVYQIPLHLEHLIRDMKKASSKKHFHKDDEFKIKYPRIEINQEINSYELSDITGSESYNKFLHHLERLRNFKENNQNYLTDLLQPIIMNHNTIGENV